MIKDVVSYLDYSIFAKVSLVIFVATFAAICIRTFLLKRSDVDKMASIPLSDKVVTKRETSQGDSKIDE